MNGRIGTNHASNEGWKLPFFTIWSGQAFSLLGSQLVGFALVWHLTESTGSATVLATAAIMEWLPRVALGPVAGTLVDRWNRRVVMLVADSVTAIATGAIIVLSSVGGVELWHIYLLMLARSLGGAFHFPAMLASTSLMVPEEQLVRIQGLNQLLQGVMNIVAPPLGALLVAIMPLPGILSIDIGTAVLAILPLLLVHIPQPDPDGAETAKPSVWQQTREGITYVWQWSALRKVILLAIVINFISMPAIILLPLLVNKEFGGGAMEIAATQSASAVGFLGGGLLLSIWGGTGRKIMMATLAMFGSGMGMLIVGLAPGNVLWLASGGIFLVGMMNVLTNGPAMALLQSIVRPEMQGRVLSLVISLANGTTPIGLAIAGPVAEITGVRMWFFLATIVFALAGLFALSDPDVRNIETGDNDPESGEEILASSLGSAS
jgi:DHA3 family macrolide efflux protein-like MFS transporter